jgi:hypothetical protein
LDDFESKAVQRLRGLSGAVKRIEMGQVIQLKIELTEHQFLERWKRECDEWQTISKELQDEGKQPSAWDVSEMQRQHMAQRGEKPMDMGRIWITGKGWLIQR